jgi:hypothetical protein
VVLFSPSRQFLYSQYLEWDMTASFKIISNLLLIHRPTIRRAVAEVEKPQIKVEVKWLMQYATGNTMSVM